MSLPDLTARTAMGSCDLVAFLRRDRGEAGVELRDWERDPAALALHGWGWSPERIAKATGLNSGDVRDLLAGKPKRPRLATHCVNGHEFTEVNTTYSRGYRQCLPCRRDRDQAARDAKKARTA